MRLLETRQHTTRALRLGLAAGLLLAGAGLSSPAPAASAGAGLVPANGENTLHLPLTIVYAPPFTTDVRIVFHSDYQGTDEIYTMDQNGNGLERLTNTAGSVLDQSPGWGPGQTRIVFQSNRDGQNEIYVMNADGTNVQRLTNNTCDDRSPSWSWVTGKIAWASNCNGVDYEIWTMDANGQNQIPITDNSVTDSAPRWSPTTNQIAYVSSNTTIRIMNGDGTNSVELTAGNNPDWSPNGLRLAYQCINTQNGSREICVIDASPGSQRTMITDLNGSTEDNPVWGPFGQTLAFISNKDEAPLFDIFTTPAVANSPITRIPSTSVIDLGSDEGGLDW